MLFAYPEMEFGGIFETEADYTSPEVLELIRAGEGIIIWPLITFSYNTIDLFTVEAVPEPSFCRAGFVSEVGLETAADACCCGG